VAALVLGTVVVTSPALGQGGPPPGGGGGTYAIDVTPDDGWDSADPNTGGHTVTFTATNTGTNHDTYEFSCYGSGGVTCTGSTPGVKALAAGAHVTITSTYSVGVAGGTLTLEALGDTGHADDTGLYTIEVVNPHSVAVTPDGATAPTRTAPGSYSETFTVLNRGGISDTYTLTCGSAAPVTCTGLSASSTTLDAGGSMTDTAFYTVLSAGTGSLTLTASNNYASDGGSYTVPVTALPPGKPLAALVRYNADNMDRGLCLTTGAGEAAGVSCGDLFVVQPMPVYRTIGRDRSLTLHYNSAAATGLFLAAVNVTEPSSVLPPDKVGIWLTVGGSTDSAEYAGPATPPSTAPRQMVLGGGLAPQPTGVYPMTVRVRNVYASGVYDSVITTTALVLNRSTSEYGRGWSLLGVEQILVVPSDTTKLLWLAGDGSMRVYTKPNPGSSVFLGAPGDAPDSLVRFDTLVNMSQVKWYRRDLKHGAAVLFDETGRHRVTRNRVGARTSFAWTTIALQTRLQTITVPPDGTNKSYFFYWNAGTALLDSVVDPYGRALRATMHVDTLTRLVQATLFPSDDADTTKFEYQGGRMTRRLRESSAITGGFAGTVYSYQNNARLTLVKIPSGLTGSDTAQITLTPWDEKGLALGWTNPEGVITTADTGLATRVDGPVAGTGDATDFWVDRFGGPFKSVELGLNATTLIWRDSVASLPALVTRLQSPNGRIVRMSWNGRGNLTELRDSTKHLGQAGLDTKASIYAYGDLNTPDSPSRVTDALGRHTDFTYTALGLTDSVIDPAGLVTKFFYKASGPLTGLVDSVADRQVETWWESDSSEHIQDQVNRFTYDAVGNVGSWKSPVGVTSTYVRDLAERVTDAYDPMGYHRSFFYDGFNRMTGFTQRVTQQNPPGVNPLLGCDTHQVQCDQSVAPFMPAGDFMSDLPTSYAHLDEGLASATDPRGVWRAFAYDARGNRSKEKDAYDFSTTARMRSYFNVAGTLDSTRARSPGALVRYRYDALGRRSAMLLATVPDPHGEVPDSVHGDSASYTYDVIGNVLIAANRQGAVTRTYYGDGSIQTQVRLVAGPKDSVLYKYDAAGARTRLYRVNSGYTDSIASFYGTTSGRLDSTLVWWAGVGGSRKVAFLWDRLGRRRQITYPSGVVVTFRYDAAGVVRRIVSTNPAPPPVASDRFSFEFRNDVLDPAGQIRHQTILCPGWRTGSSEDPLGMACGASLQALTTNQYTLFGMLTYQQQSAPATVTDSMWYDRSGNLAYQRSTDHADGSQYLFDNAGTQDHSWTNVLTQKRDYVTGGTLGSYGYTQDLARKDQSAPAGLYWYDALGRTSGIARADAQSEQGPNSCVYDAEGQLVKPCDQAAPALAFDGDNVGAAGAAFRFVDGPGVDDPLLGIYRGTCMVTTEFYWITDGQGRQIAVATSDGSFNSGAESCYRNFGGAYAGGTQNSYGFASDRFGSANVPKMSFFRNRVYDQDTGRWTQEDPIGVAGGLNLYQYAGNDPVQFTDPFGLCPPKDDNTQDCPTAEQAEAPGSREGPVDAVGLQVTIAGPLFGVTGTFGFARTEAGNTRAFVTFGSEEGVNVGLGFTHTVSTNLAAFSGPSEGPDASLFVVTGSRVTNKNGESVSGGGALSPLPGGLGYARTTTLVSQPLPLPTLPIKTPDPYYPGTH